MTDKEAMKLALKALELLTGAWQTFDALDYGDNAITALKARLADHAMREVQRLGQEIEQEPVAWMRKMFSPELGEFFDYKDGAFANETYSEGWTPLYTTPPQRTEQCLGFDVVIDPSMPANAMKFVEPPQRKPLTDDLLTDLWYKQSLDWMEFARAIEAAHGIKETT